MRVSFIFCFVKFKCNIDTRCENRGKKSKNFKFRLLFMLFDWNLNIWWAFTPKTNFQVQNLLCVLYEIGHFHCKTYNDLNISLFVTDWSIEMIFLPMSHSSGFTWHKSLGSLWCLTGLPISSYVRIRTNLWVSNFNFWSKRNLPTVKLYFLDNGLNAGI